MLAEEETRYIARRHVARAYGEGGQPGRHLAARIKTRTDKRVITKITDDNGLDHYTTRDITQFRETYATLYTSQGPVDNQELDAYLSDVAIAWLLDDQREFLSQAITQQEVRAAIKTLPNKNASGPD